MPCYMITMLHPYAHARSMYEPCCEQAIVDTVETLLPRYLGKQPLGDANGGLLEPLQTAYDAVAGTLGSGQR